MAPDGLSLVFSALADPTRRAILAKLALGPQTVGQIAEPFPVSAPAITKHLKVLERAGLVSVDRQAQCRPRTIEAAPMKDAMVWMEQYRQLWDESFDRLDAYLKQIQDPNPPNL